MVFRLYTVDKQILNELRIIFSVTDVLVDIEINNFTCIILRLFFNAQGKELNAVFTTPKFLCKKSLTKYRSFIS